MYHVEWIFEHFEKVRNIPYRWIIDRFEKELPIQIKLSLPVPDLFHVEKYLWGDFFILIKVKIIKIIVQKVISINDKKQNHFKIDREDKKSLINEGFYETVENIHSYININYSRKYILRVIECN